MKRIFTFILSVLFAVFFTLVHAQQNIFVWKNDGNISVKSIADIDSITSSVGSWIFNIRTSAATSVTTNMLQASISVSLANDVKFPSQNMEIGICFSSLNAIPTYSDEYKRLGASAANYEFTLNDLDPGTTYY